MLRILLEQARKSIDRNHAGRGTQQYEDVPSSKVRGQSALAGS